MFLGLEQFSEQFREFCGLVLCRNRRQFRAELLRIGGDDVEPVRRATFCGSVVGKNLHLGSPQLGSQASELSRAMWEPDDEFGKLLPVGHVCGDDIDPLLNWV